MSAADSLTEIVDAAVARFANVTDVAASKRPTPTDWSPKEEVGHLIDSAGNNLQRFVRAQEQDRLEFPGYAQDHWVRSQHYQSADWTELVSFWRLFNRRLASVIRHIPSAALATECRIGGGEPVTLRFLVDDYVVHLQHHLAQIDAKLGTR